MFVEFNLMKTQCAILKQDPGSNQRGKRIPLSGNNISLLVPDLQDSKSVFERGKYKESEQLVSFQRGRITPGWGCLVPCVWMEVVWVLYPHPPAQPATGSRHTPPPQEEGPDLSLCYYLFVKQMRF